MVKGQEPAGKELRKITGTLFGVRISNASAPLKHFGKQLLSNMLNYRKDESSHFLSFGSGHGNGAVLTCECGGTKMLKIKAQPGSCTESPH